MYGSLYNQTTPKDFYFLVEFVAAVDLQPAETVTWWLVVVVCCRGIAAFVSESVPQVRHQIVLYRARK